jgi:hypothetical protein
MQRGGQIQGASRQQHPGDTKKLRASLAAIVKNVNILWYCLEQLDFTTSPTPPVFPAGQGSLASGLPVAAHGPPAAGGKKKNAAEKKNLLNG